MLAGLVEHIAFLSLSSIKGRFAIHCVDWYPGHSPSCAATMSAVMRLLAFLLVLLHESELSGAETVIITEEYSYTATNTLFYDVFGGPVEKTYPEISTIARSV